MTYQEFKERIIPTLMDVEDFKKYRMEIVEEGYNADMAKKLHFRYTKNIDAFEDWLYKTNLSLFNGKSDKLIGDILIISNKDEEFVRFQLKKLYDLVCQDEIIDVNKIKEILTQQLTLLESSNMELMKNHSDDYDLIKHILILRPLPYESNKDALKDAVYKVENEIAVVLYFDMNSKKDAIKLSAKVPKALLKRWHKTENEVLEEALINTYGMQQPRLFNMLDMHSYVLKECVSKEGAFMAINIDPRSYEYNLSEFLLLTTTQKVNGAIAWFYPGVREKIAEIMGGDYYVIFADTGSIYVYDAKKPTVKIEVLLRTLGKEEGLFKKFGSTSSGNEHISKKVYFYDANTKKILEKKI